MLQPYIPYPHAYDNSYKFITYSLDESFKRKRKSKITMWLLTQDDFFF